MKCPLCQLEAKPHLENAGYTFQRCSPCHHVFVDHVPADDHVESVYGDDYFFGGGSGYDDYLANEGMLRERGKFYERKLRALIAPGRVLDVGSSAGFFASAFADEGWEAYGLEPNRRMVDAAVTSSGVPTTCGTMENFDGDEVFDAVLAIQVAAHFCDLHRSFRNCFQALRPGGLLLVETWNVDSLTARVTGSGWHEYSPPSVLHCFSKESLKRLTQAEGFELVECRTTLKKIRASHAKSLLRSKAETSVIMRTASTLSAVIPDQLEVYYPADDLFWAIFRRPLISQ